MSDRIQALKTAQALFDRAVEAFHEAVASKDVNRVCRAVAEVGSANARVMVADEVQTRPSETAPRSTVEAFEAAFLEASYAAATAARWATEYAVKATLGDDANAHGIGEGLQEQVERALSDLSQNLREILEQHRLEALEDSESDPSEGR